MRNERVFETESGRNGLTFQLNAQDLDLSLPDVPVLSETLLLMELLVRERTVDLSEISQVVLGDLGAVIQIMRLAGRENAGAEDRPARIEDCISGLGLQACVEAISKRPLKRSTCDPAILETWTHARKVAEDCRFLADEALLPVNPEDAYLVGLFHAMSSLPSVLSWGYSVHIPSNPDIEGLRMAEAWSLPACVVEYFSEPRSHASAIRWREIVRSVHQPANSSRIDSTLHGHLPLQPHASAWVQAVSI